MKITNNSKRVEGFHTKQGFRQVKPGETRDLELLESSVDLAKRLPYIGIEGVDRGSAMQNAKPTPMPTAASIEGYAVRDKGRGWFVVTKDGHDVTKSLRPDDISGFDTFTDDEKAAFVEMNKAKD